tara:strand:+ start:222 stop:572 length:351 start_codon:yes stop_codon:yes gene_type:complete
MNNSSELFITLVSSLVSQTWIQLGKMKNPVTDKIEKNLDAASMSIDMLSMLLDKTKNNLDEHESKLLNQSLNDLRMNFIFEKNADSKNNNEEKESDKESKKKSKASAKKKSKSKKK